MGDIQSHLATWEAAGLIDGEATARIRSWEATQAGAVASGRPNIGSIFGPGLSIGEVFAYVGAMFLLAATDVFLARIGSAEARADAIYALGSAIQAVALVAIGIGLRRGDARRARAAGVAFLVASVHAGVAGGFAASSIGLDGPSVAVVGSLVATVVAVGARRLHPALTTQTALLGSITVLSWALLAWVQQAWFGTPTFEPDAPVRSTSDQVALTIASGAWWLLTGLLLALIGLYEARRGGTRAASRAGLSRLWGGLAAFVGFSMAMTRSDQLPNGEYGRVIEPWIAEVAILVVAAILVERAFRRDSVAFVVPAALGMIIALTDFNFSYLSEQTEVGLLIEGLILLAVGFGADRIRRRLGRRPEGDAPTTPPADTVGDQPAEAVAPGE